MSFQRVSAFGDDPDRLGVHAEDGTFVGLVRQDADDVGVDGLLEADVAPGPFGEVPAVLQHLVEQLRRLELAPHLAGHGSLHGFEDVIPLGYEPLVFDVFGRACIACGVEDQLGLDHHRPLESGHPLLHNAVPLCKSCNSKKGTTSPENFYDGWKLTEIEVLLWETRGEFERRFEGGTAP